MPSPQRCGINSKVQQPSTTQAFFLGCRAVVSLLLGHMQLHGLQQLEQATISYERVQEGDVDATIAALAKQGLQRCRSEDIDS